MLVDAGSRTRVTKPAEAAARETRANRPPVKLRSIRQRIPTCSVLSGAYVSSRRGVAHPQPAERTRCIYSSGSADSSLFCAAADQCRDTFSSFFLRTHLRSSCFSFPLLRAFASIPIRLFLSLLLLHAFRFASLFFLLPSHAALLHRCSLPQFHSAIGISDFQ